MKPEPWTVTFNKTMGHSNDPPLEVTVNATLLNVIETGVAEALRRGHNVTEDDVVQIETVRHHLEHPLKGSVVQL